MAKDKEGHGSNKRAEHGPYGNGNEYHAGRVIGAPSHLRENFDISRKSGRLKLKKDED